MQSKLFLALKRFRHGERGVVLVLFVLLIIPLLIVAAVAIEFSQTLVVKRQLTGAVDSAALALGALPTLDSEELRPKALSYISAHYPPDAIGTLTHYDATREGENINVTATAEVETTFLRVIGYDTLAVTVASNVVTKGKKLEVVMVLDNSGSMSGTKMDSLKLAANTLVDILFGDDTISDRVKVGLVPFVGAVNAGIPKESPLLDIGNPLPLNVEHITQLPVGQSLINLLTAIAKPWRGCVRARTEPYDTQDDPPSASVAGTLFTPYFAPDEPSGYPNDYIRWPIPGADDQTNFLKYLASPLIFGDGPNSGCGQAKVQPLTNDKTVISNAITAMQANGSTVIPEGLGWGWRVISPGEPFTDGVPYDDQDTIKAIILLTDGENNVSPNNSANGSIFSAFGYANQTPDHLPGNTNQALDNKTSTLCTNIKADKDGDNSDQDILLYTIVFNVNSGNIQALMRNCATDQAKYFNSPSVADIEGTFQNIAVGLNELRVTQ